MKKIMICFISAIALISITGCGNKKENPVKNLCEEFESTKSSYELSNINRENLFDELKKYNEECPNKELKTCVTLNNAVNEKVYSFLTIKEEIVSAFLNEITRSCKLDAENYR